MVFLRLLPLLGLFFLQGAFAQSSGCPTLPAASSLSWQSSSGPGFLYCRAMREDDSQAFAVMLGQETSFRPRRGNRSEEAVIDGHHVHWYRSELPMEPNTQVRETLLELGRDRIAHIVVRAYSDQQLQETLALAASLRFSGG